MIGTPSDAAHGYDPPELRETAGALVAKGVIRENDARLIAAAPDLLAAAREARQELRAVAHLIEQDIEVVSLQSVHETITALRAAIAKAEEV